MSKITNIDAIKILDSCGNPTTRVKLWSESGSQGVAKIQRSVHRYGASTVIHRSHLLSISLDAPIMVSVIDSEDRVRKLIPYLDAMVDKGSIAMSEVEVIKYVHQGGARS